MRADIRFAKARKNRPAPLGMTILRELAKAVLDENVVATQTLKPQESERLSVGAKAPNP
jgi:hypothetical protein